MQGCELGLAEALMRGLVKAATNQLRHDPVRIELLNWGYQMNLAAGNETSRTQSEGGLRRVQSAVFRKPGSGACTDCVCNTYAPHPSAARVSA
jgi:hypothetical protein